MSRAIPLITACDYTDYGYEHCMPVFIDSLSRKPLTRRERRWIRRRMKKEEARRARKESRRDERRKRRRRR